MNSVEGPLYPTKMADEDRFLCTVDTFDIWRGPDDIVIIHGPGSRDWGYWKPGGEWWDTLIEAVPESVRLHAQALYHLHQ